MKNTYKTIRCVANPVLIVVLAVQASFVIAANADTPVPTASTNTPAPAVSNNSPAPTTNNTENWEDLTDAFFTQIGANNAKPSYAVNCSGMIVTPNGDVFILTGNKNGVCVSRDQGATWSVVPNNNVFGTDNNGFEFSMPYPYDGRMAFFGQDGEGQSVAGGITLDDGKTWKPFSKYKRNMEFGDLDWNTHDPQTIFALTHEPYFTVVSNDGGKSWQQLYPDETGGREEASYSLGVVDAKTFLRANANERTSKASERIGTIELSNDSGQTWTQVGNYRVIGRRPVHYGSNIYWTTDQGVIKSTNGKDWTLTGPGAEGARWGPYFGASEQEFVVVTPQNFLKTEDGGKTWTPIAKYYRAPGTLFGDQPDFCYFGWDAKHNILYASAITAPVYRLKL